MLAVPYTTIGVFRSPMGSSRDSAIFPQPSRAGEHPRGGCHHTWDAPRFAAGVAVSGPVSGGITLHPTRAGAIEAQPIEGAGNGLEDGCGHHLRARGKSLGCRRLPLSFEHHHTWTRDPSTPVLGSLHFGRC